MKKYIIAFAMATALGINMYMDAKSQQAQQTFVIPWTVKQIRCALYGDC